MDDILPVMIYVAARAQVVDFPVYVKIIDDYVKIRGVFELEERVITTLYVATEDICKKSAIDQVWSQPFYLIFSFFVLSLLYL